MEILFGLHASVVPWGRPEVLVAVSPALFSTAIVQLRAQLQRVPHGIWIQDIYTRGLEETKGRSSTVTRIMRIVESQVLRRATGVAVIHERFRAYVIDELGVAPDRVTVIRNWTHLPEPSHFDRTKTREALGWADNEFVVLHAGNMGVKQGLEHVVETARNATDRSIRYVLMGNGSRRDALLRAADGLSNVQFIDSLDDEEYSAALRSADALLVNELPELREMSVPSKLTSYFSTGLPVIASTDPSSSTADEIRASGAGILVDPSDVRSIELAAQQLKNSPTDAASIGQRGPGYVSEVLAPETAYEKFGQWVDEMARRRSRS
jgi:glycosyltransferase involved in cell wall biosynthesis